MKRIIRNIYFNLYVILFGYILLRKTKNFLSFNWKNIKFNRTQIINAIIMHLKNKNKNTRINYLEIGCFDNNNFNKIDNHNVFKIGVDPEKGGTLKMTSDDFFQKNKEKFHCIFIDGFHEYTQVQKDLLNSINCLNDEGFIILYDCIPRNYIEEHLPRFPSNKSWTGDVWKICSEIIRSSGIIINIFLCDNGVGIIKIDKKNFKYNYMNNILRKKRFKYFIKNEFKLFPVNEINHINELDLNF